MNGETNGRRFKDDRVINLINTKFITLKDEDMKRNNKILHEIVQKLVTTLKEKNEFFNDHFRNIMFVGSYYKGTKVGKPEEFDFDLIIQLPIKYELVKYECDVPGFTKLKLCPDIYKPGWERYSKILKKWVTPEGYLNHHEFFQYMESSFSNRPDAVTIDNKEYKLDMKKSGPAFTLCIKGSDSLVMSVDLVPVLEFKTAPPVPGDFSSGSWFAVPKSKRDLKEPHLYWRMSFYHFEKDMLSKSGCLKPVIRQLKKLRDTANWNSIFPSYHIETLSLHRIKAMGEKPEMQKYSMMEHFMDMLVQLKEACETEKISNFWDVSDNLLAEVKSAQLAGIKGRLNKIIKQVEKDPFSIVDYVLTKEERSSIETELTDLRNSGKSSKAVDQQVIKINEAGLMRSKSCNSTSFSESVDPSILAYVFKAMNAAVLKGKAPISTVLEEGNQDCHNYAKSDNQQPLKANQVEIMQSKSCEVTAKQKSENSLEDRTENVSTPLATTTLSASMKSANPEIPGEENKNSTSKSAQENDDFAQIMNMLKAIQCDIADTKDAVTLLTRRVAAVEDKVDVLLSQSNAENKEWLQFGPNSIHLEGIQRSRGSGMLLN